MAGFPTYDPAADAVRLNGAAPIMLTFLMKSKFGERFDPETLFHPGLAALINQLDAAIGYPKERGDCFSREDMFSIAERVVEQSLSIGWWSMTAEEREAYLQQAASPWVLSDDQLETIIEDIASLLFRRRQVVAAADAAGEPEN